MKELQEETGVGYLIFKYYENNRSKTNTRANRRESCTLGHETLPHPHPRFWTRDPPQISFQGKITVVLVLWLLNNNKMRQYLRSRAGPCFTTWANRGDKSWLVPILISPAVPDLDLDSDPRLLSAQSAVGDLARKKIYFWPLPPPPRQQTADQKTKWDHIPDEIYLRGKRISQGGWLTSRDGRRKCLTHQVLWGDLPPPVRVSRPGRNGSCERQGKKGEGGDWRCVGKELMMEWSSAPEKGWRGGGQWEGGDGRREKGGGEAWGARLRNLLWSVGMSAAPLFPTGMTISDFWVVIRLLAAKRGLLGLLGGGNITDRQFSVCLFFLFSKQKNGRNTKSKGMKVTAPQPTWHPST